jgi:hypothetical protein
MWGADGDDATGYWRARSARLSDPPGHRPRPTSQDLSLLDRIFGPRPERSGAEERGLLGEFSFDGTTALAAIAHLYDPAAEADGAPTLAEFLASRFAGRPAIGDRTRFGAVELIVRDMQGDAITQVGVELDPAPKQRWRSWLKLLHQRRGRCSWLSWGQRELLHRPRQNTVADGLLVEDTTRKGEPPPSPVRRQRCWDNGLGKLREALAHQFADFRRPAADAASGGWRWSVV